MRLHPTLALAALLLTQAAAALVPDHAQKQLQARTNLPINGPSFNLPEGSSFNSVTVALNDNAEVAFKVQILPGTNAAGVWFGGNGSGGIVCQSENVVDVLITDVSLDNQPRVVYAQTDGNTDGIYRCDPLAPSSVLVTASPLGANNWGSPQTLDDGSIGYRASFNDGRAWVAFNNGTTTVFASEFGITPGSPYGFLFTPAYGPTGKIAGKVQIREVVPVPQHDEIQINNGAGSIATLATIRSIDPSSDFVGFNNSGAINGFDQVAFVASLFAGGSGVFILSEGQPPLQIAQTGVDGLVEIEAFAPVLNDSGLVAFRGRDDMGQAIFIGDGVDLKKVVSQGDLLPSDLGMAQIGQNDASPVFGGGIAINDNGDIAFIAALHPPGNNQVEWGSGVYVAYAGFDKIFSDGYE
ncbi:MAG: hypothetical protein KDI71_02950 [Xanthomonadales bacterium]|nr:hypothetical protein [Xanthomonadales bacterium]